MPNKDYVKRPKVACSICGKEIVGSGMKTHIQMSHGVVPEGLVNQENATATKTKLLEVKPDIEPKKTEAIMTAGDCPGCKEREDKLKLLNDKEAKLLKTIDELTLQSNKVPDLEQQIASFKTSGGEGQTTYPDVKTFIEHCEGGNCEHKTQWQEKKKSIIDQTLNGLSDDFINQEASKRGIAKPKLDGGVRVTVPLNARPGDTLVFKDLN